MKRFILLCFIASLLLLTGCTYKDSYEKLEAEYYELMVEKDELYDRYISFYSEIDDSVNVLYDYFEEGTISFDEAYKCYWDIIEILKKY